MKKTILIGAMGLFALTAPSLGHAADATKGAKVFNKCKACHSVVDLKNKVGPTLNGIAGRKAATREGYKYSKAMIKAGEDGLVWDDANLDKYITKPKDLVKGTKMIFPGLKKATQRADLIAYLKSVPVAK